MASAEHRVAVDRLLEKFLRSSVVLSCKLAPMPYAMLVGCPGIEAVGGLAHRAFLFSSSDCRSNSDRHCLGNLVLYRENVGEVAVITLGPNVIACLGLDQLRGDADAVAGFTQ